MADVCNIDGVVLPESEAKISVLDRGFLFGDSVYEVMRTRDGVPFAWAEHLARMRKSADGIGLEIATSDGEIMRRVHATRAVAGGGERGKEHYIRIVITRGTGSAPNIDISYAPGPETVVLLVRDLPDVHGKLARLAIVPRIRTDRRALDPAIKSGNYLNNVLGLAEAKAAGATDCLFLNADGYATEASTSNFWVLKDGVFRTPPLKAGLLKGITRGLLLECLRDTGRTVEEADLRKEDVLAADELFLSSTLRDMSPVTHVDGTAVGDGTAGPETLKLMADFGAWCSRKVRETDGPGYFALVGS